MVMADTAATVSAVFAGVAAAAALATVLFARDTVSEAKAARREAQQAHAEATREQARLLDATTAAHDEEMRERERAFRSELVLQRLAQLGRLEELLGEVADIARFEIANPPPSIGVGRPGSWTRITGAFARVEAAATLCERLEPGPGLVDALTAAKIMSHHLRTPNIPPSQIVGDAMSMLDRVVHASQTDGSLMLPSRTRETT
jgi:hypothetical protein